MFIEKFLLKRDFASPLKKYAPAEGTRHHELFPFPKCSGPKQLLNGANSASVNCPPILKGGKNTSVTTCRHRVSCHALLLPARLSPFFSVVMIQPYL